MGDKICAPLYVEPTTIVLNSIVCDRTMAFDDEGRPTKGRYVPPQDIVLHNNLGRGVASVDINPAAFGSTILGDHIVPYRDRCIDDGEASAESGMPISNGEACNFGLSPFAVNSYYGSGIISIYNRRGYYSRIQGIRTG